MSVVSHYGLKAPSASRSLVAAIVGSLALLVSHGAMAASPAVTFTGAYGAIPPGGGASTLTFTISNNTGTTLTNGAYSYNAAPNTTFVVAVPTTTCTGATTSTSANLVTASNFSVVANSNCTVTYQVNTTVNNPTLSAANLTYAGADGASPSALTAPAPPAPVPTLSQWALALLASLMAGGGVLALRQRSLRA